MLKKVSCWRSALYSPHLASAICLTSLSPPRFFKMLEENPLRAWYGESHVFKAAERGAIGKLLVSDELFRCVCGCRLRPAVIPNSVKS